MRDWVTLDEHVRDLLGEGKSSAHEDFQRLFRIYGETKIRQIAQTILKEKRKHVESSEKPS